MNNHIITSISVAIVVVVMASCQSQQKENQATSTASKDTIANQSIKPTESGYADVNGLKMYYEVYGKGKPIVLLKRLLHFRDAFASLFLSGWFY